MTKPLVKIPAERIESVILFVRGEKVILDTDLAVLYDVETRSLLQAVKRNSERFPADFVFQLTRKESDSLRSQIVISKGRGGRRYLPYAFTEHGAIMAANVLNSKTAVQASVQVVRAFGPVTFGPLGYSRGGCANAKRSAAGSEGLLNRIMRWKY